MVKKTSRLVALRGLLPINPRACVALAILSAALIIESCHAPHVATMAAPPAEQWSVGYWTPWGKPPLPSSAIEWGGLTHVIYSGALVRANGSLDLQTQLVTAEAPRMISHAHAHDVKVLLGIGQGTWLGQTTTLQTAAANNLTSLVDNIMSTVNGYGFDGVDIDWEPFDSSANGPAMKQLAGALRAKLGTRPLTCAAVVNDYAFWGSVHNYFDRVQVMTYDLTGTWNPYSWHNAALYGPSDNAVWSIDMAVKRFTSAGVPGSKLSVGIPFYGWQWSGGEITGPKQRWSSTPSLRQIYYQELAPMITAQNRNWDSQAQVPYLSVSSGTAPPRQFVTYDDPESIMAKVNYAKNKGLGGWIIWELAADYLPAQTPNQPLLAAVKTSLSTSRLAPVRRAPDLSRNVSPATATGRQADILPLRTSSGQ